MSMFQNPGYLNLARQFMAGGQRPDSPYAGRYPDMTGYSKTPAGTDIMRRVMAQMQRRGYQPAGSSRIPYTTVAPSRQVKRETTEYFDGQQANAGQALSNVSRRP